MTTALVTGVNQLVQGVVYALPAFPCQILSDAWIQNGSGQAIINAEIEPGVFANGGSLTAPAPGRTVIVKKHTIGNASQAATNYSAAVMMDKPSYYWRLNDPDPAARELMQGLNGTISGGVTLAQPGALVDGDKCMAFDGVNGKIVTSGSVVLPLVMSFEVWVKTSDYLGLLRALLTQPNNSPAFLISAGNIYFYDNVNSIGVTPSYLPNDGMWHHIVYVLNGLTFMLYLDGVFQASASAVRVNSTPSAVIAIGHSISNATYWNGSIDEVAIYPYALTAAQISQHYKARSSPFVADSYASKIIQSGPSNYWRLGETYGTVAADIIGGTNGTISGGVVLNGESGMTFNGTSGKIVTSNKAITTPFSVELWFKRNSNVGSQVLFCNTWGGDNFVIQATPIDITIWTGTAGPTLPMNYDTLWHHVVLVCAGGVGGKIYLDGVIGPPTDTTPITFSLGTAKPLEIGFDPNWTYWNGSIDEVAIYPRALTPTEILAHYNAGKR